MLDLIEKMGGLYGLIVFFSVIALAYCVFQDGADGVYELHEAIGTIVLGYAVLYNVIVLGRSFVELDRSTKEHEDEKW